MNKVVLSVVTALAVTAAAPAMAADMPTKARMVAPAPAPSPWDIAIGGVVMSDYIFRGVSQSNKAASGGAYFEPQFTTSIGTFYVGLGALAISWPSGPGFGFTDPSAEIDIYGGWRTKLGPVSLDFGAIYYLYPGETFNGFTTNSDFLELYAKASMDIVEGLNVGAAVFYTPDLLHYSETFATVGVSNKPDAFYVAGTAKWTTPWAYNGIGAYISGELGHWFIDDVGFLLAGATADPSYTYWNAGLALTYKAITVDLRYHDTNQSVQDCANFLLVAVPNNSNNWCGDRFVASLKFDTTLSALK